ncbi:acyl-CoA dehydrogenase family protein [Mycobacterium paraintracellulare]|uniref:Acyl-CoA dehydrogenase n=1 Tax=Mycobacterium paraintracellulare TaxID=1138383 RepID=A0ABN6AXJ3_9MYCO|nr:hypothetical protein MPRI_47500 [Mycobacterium paraintracellulare]
MRALRAFDWGYCSPISSPVAEELAGGWMSLAGADGGQVVTQPNSLYGNEEQRKKYLTQMTSGQVCATMALTEPGASDRATVIALNAVRIHGGYGYSTEYDVERYFRDAPLTIVGEGNNEVQRNVIAAQLVSRARL